MTLVSQITEDWKQAMRDKQEIKKTILNFVLAQIKYKKIELQKDPEDADVVQILKKEIKSLLESISFLEKSGKHDELLEEQQKKALLEFYLPATLSKEQTQNLINEYITKLGITDLKTQRWLLMKEIKASQGANIDGALVNDCINSML